MPESVCTPARYSHIYEPAPEAGCPGSRFADGHFPLKTGSERPGPARLTPGSVETDLICRQTFRYVKPRREGDIQFCGHFSWPSA